jgi:ribosomal protein S6--L-glutamate ligase
MKIAILSRDPNLYSTCRLKQAGVAKGHEMCVIDYRRCYLGIDAHTPNVFYDGKSLDNLDAIIPCIAASRTFYGAAVVRQFEIIGSVSVNTSQAISRSHDRLHCLQILAREGINLPVTGVAYTAQDIESLIDILGGAPLVIKLLALSTERPSVMLAETRRAARTAIRALQGLDANILVQEYIQEAAGTDIRCLVLDGKVIAAIKRQGATEDFLANLDQNCKTEKIKLTPAERHTAVRAAKAIGLSMAGVDLLRSHRGPVILAVHASPALEDLEPATGVAVADQIIDYSVKIAPGRCVSS